MDEDLGGKQVRENSGKNPKKLVIMCENILKIPVSFEMGEICHDMHDTCCDAVGHCVFAEVSTCLKVWK